MSKISKNIKNNLDHIIKNNNKYYFALVISRNKIKIISSSRDKSQAKNNTIDFLNKKLKSKENLPVIYRFTIKKNENKGHKDKSMVSLNVDLLILLEEIYIKFENNKIKLKKNPNICNSNRIFIDNKFLENNNEITDKLIKTISKKYFNTQINSFSLNRVSHFL